MGILLIVATFLLTSNTNGIVFAQDSSPIKVTISGLPKQTADASTEVTLSNKGSNDYAGEAVINIPGIGGGNIFIVYQAQSGQQFYNIKVTNLPGQSAPSDTTVQSEEGQFVPVTIDIPGIGSGTIKLF